MYFWKALLVIFLVLKSLLHIQHLAALELQENLAHPSSSSLSSERPLIYFATRYRDTHGLITHVKEITQV